ncbi:NEK5, partial [Symbiodinium sp. KB8]
MSDKEQQAAYTEVRLLYEMDSPYVVEYYDSFLDDDRLNIVMEYCDRGDLQQALKRQGGKPVPEETIWGVFIQIALGLHDLHAARILHRDMKSANVFMKSTAEVKIGDLGVARLLGTQSQFAKTCVGTPYYLSPELCQGHAYNAKSDLWALGCVLYEMATLQHPFEASNQGALLLASAPVVSAARDLDITLPPAALHMHQSALAKARLAEER